MNDPDAVTTDFERHRQVRAKVNERNKGAVFDALAGADITEVHVEFDGEGDSGQIESITAFRGEVRTDVPVMTVRVQSVVWGGTEPVTTEWPLIEAIETLCYDYLEDTHGGWENNDGAFGEFILDVANRTVELEFNGRFTDVFTSTHTF